MDNKFVRRQLELAKLALKGVKKQRKYIIELSNISDNDILIVDNAIKGIEKQIKILKKELEK